MDFTAADSSPSSSLFPVPVPVVSSSASLASCRHFTFESNTVLNLVLSPPASHSRLTIVCRPVEPGQRFASLKSSVESRIGERLLHMGLLDRATETVFHFNDPVGAAQQPMTDSLVADVSASPVLSGPDAPGGAAAAVASSSPDPTNSLNELTQQPGDQTKSNARFVSTTLPEFWSLACPEDRFYLDLPLDEQVQMAALERCWELTGPDSDGFLYFDSKPRKYNALSWNCQQIVFWLLFLRPVPGQTLAMKEAAQAAVEEAKQKVGEFVTRKKLQLQEVVQMARDGRMAAALEEKKAEVEQLLKEKKSQLSQALTQFSVMNMTSKREKEKAGVNSQI